MIKEYGFLLANTQLSLLNVFNFFSRPGFLATKDSRENSYKHTIQFKIK